MFGVARLALGAGVRVTDRLSAGVAVSALIGINNQKIFPRTSSAAPAFFGYEIPRLIGVAPAVKAGLRWQATPALTLALTYAPQTDLTLRGNKAVVNFDALGIGKVRYRDVKTSGLNLPQELTIGAAYRVNERLLLAADFAWLDWSHAVKESVLRLKEPDHPNAPPVIEARARLDWRDQYVVSLGLAYDASPGVRLYLGYNYARSPVPP